jgi:hypothetical protein
MRPRLIFLAASAPVGALLGTLLLACSPKTSAPETAVRQFYSVLTADRISGLPSDAQMKTLRPLISLELDTLIETARHAQLHFIYAYPDEKPPWIEGNLFGSLFEGHHDFTVDEAMVCGDTALVPVRLEYRGDKDTVRWNDEAVVVKYVEGWRVSDIRFKGAWDFKPGAGLRALLKDTL